MSNQKLKEAIENGKKIAKENEEKYYAEIQKNNLKLQKESTKKYKEAKKALGDGSTLYKMIETAVICNQKEIIITSQNINDLVGIKKGFRDLPVADISRELTDVLNTFEGIRAVHKCSSNYVSEYGCDVEWNEITITWKV